MYRTQRLTVSGLSAILLSMTGCGSLPPASPLVTKPLQMISAGHTGCLPEDNILSNVTMNPNGSGIWNATCKGKVYLCSAVASVNSSETFSCAPAVQN